MDASRAQRARASSRSVHKTRTECRNMPSAEAEYVGRPACNGCYLVSWVSSLPTRHPTHSESWKLIDDKGNRNNYTYSTPARLPQTARISIYLPYCCHNDNGKPARRFAAAPFPTQRSISSFTTIHPTFLRWKKATTSVERHLPSQPVRVKLRPQTDVHLNRLRGFPPGECRRPCA